MIIHRESRVSDHNAWGLGDFWGAELLPGNPAALFLANEDEVLDCVEEELSQVGLDSVRLQLERLLRFDGEGPATA